MFSKVSSKNLSQIKQKQYIPKYALTLANLAMLGLSLLDFY